MEYGFYAVDVWGERLGHGTAADPRWCTLTGVAKTNVAAAPYAVANEFICGRLGFMIGLPIPPGVIVVSDDNQLAYVCLRFGLKGERPPPAIPNELAADNPSIAAGVIAFDVWIGNGDRHNGNIAYSRGLLPVVVFDHSHALLGYAAGQGVKTLADNVDQPLLAGCLLPHIESGAAIRRWTDRIGALHDDLIAEVCNCLVRPGGLTKDEADAAASFLCKRKVGLYDRIKGAQAALPKVKDW